MTNTDNAQPRKEQNKNNKARSPGTLPTMSPGEPDGAGTRTKVARIRELNDQLRTTGRGGMVVMTDGIAGLGTETVGQIFAAIGAFTDFNADNDPWGEHDCARLEVHGHWVIWKIDYYDRSRRIHSPDAADPKVTVRVLTVMLADEY
jgi:hypothetical protein